MQTQHQTHEAYVQGVRTLAIARAIEAGRISDEQAETLRNVKLVYGLGLRGGYRGVTVFGAWANGHGPTDAVEIAAMGEESWLQLAGTTIHELAHVLAGSGEGHSSNWKSACERMGLRRAMAAGMRYSLAALDGTLRERIAALARHTDGSPSFMSTGLLGTVPQSPRPCSAGTGVRGGTSRGKGSGSRMLKVACSTCGYTARTTSRWLDEMGAPHCADIEHGRMDRA